MELEGPTLTPSLGVKTGEKLPGPFCGVQAICTQVEAAAPACESPAQWADLGKVVGRIQEHHLTLFSAGTLETRCLGSARCARRPAGSPELPSSSLLHLTSAVGASVTVPSAPLKEGGHPATSWKGLPGSAARPAPSKPAAAPGGARPPLRRPARHPRGVEVQRDGGQGCASSHSAFTPPSMYSSPFGPLVSRSGDGGGGAEGWFPEPTLGEEGRFPARARGLCLRATGRPPGVRSPGRPSVPAPGNYALGRRPSSFAAVSEAVSRGDNLAPGASAPTAAGKTASVRGKPSLLGCGPALSGGRLQHVCHRSPLSSPGACNCYAG